MASQNCMPGPIGSATNGGTRFSSSSSTRRSGRAFAGLALFNSTLLAQVFPSREGEEVIPFLDQPPEPPKPERNLLKWEEFDSWITPNNKFFHIAHYNKPVIDEKNWKLEIAG